MRFLQVFFGLQSKLGVLQNEIISSYVYLLAMIFIFGILLPSFSNWLILILYNEIFSGYVLAMILIFERGWKISATKCDSLPTTLHGLGCSNQ